MADYVILRRGRNALSSIIHVALNITLAVVSTALTIISGNWIFAVLLVLLSKWRIVAVRSRYWWLNIKANLVDLIVGISLALLVYMAGTTALNIWHVIFTFIYAIWLVFIKPQSSTRATEIQALMAIFFGSFAASLIATATNPIVGSIVCFIIGYGSTRHVLSQSDDHDYLFTTFIFGIVLAEIFWIFYHWTIAYELSFAAGSSFFTSFAIPQYPIVATLAFFVLARGYGSAIRHDGKIRSDDIVMPAVFSVIIMLLMIFFYSSANFNI